MTEEEILAIAGQALMTAFMVAGPVLGVGLGIGLLVSLFQAATQIQEQTLSFIPKIVAMLVTLFLTGPWMITKITEFAQDLFEKILEIS